VREFDDERIGLIAGDIVLPHVADGDSFIRFDLRQLPDRSDFPDANTDADAHSHPGSGSEPYACTGWKNGVRFRR
jgi:hypothetical protein